MGATQSGHQGDIDFDDERKQDAQIAFEAVSGGITQTPSGDATFLLCSLASPLQVCRPDLGFTSLAAGVVVDKFATSFPESPLLAAFASVMSLGLIVRDRAS